MQVQNCMSKDVVSTHRAVPLREIINLFKSKNFHSIPVIDKANRLVGVVSFEDILKVFQPYSADLQQMLDTIPFIEDARDEELLETDISAEMGMLVVADDIMSTNVITISPDEDIGRALSTMKLYKISRLFVVKEDDELIGVVTLFDILFSLFKDKGVIE